MKVSNFIGAVCLVTFGLGAGADEIETPSSACVVHMEGDFDVKVKIESMGCVKGEPLLLFNEAKSRRWQSLLPIRAAAVVACDMDKPITDSQDQGLQYVMCTFSGEILNLSMDKRYQKGWIWVN
jgi:hypothetical protein|tara:strand:- start:561 stop:932 length:372 start_codon:yes stop_codon:yes gene_type:complete